MTGPDAIMQGIKRPRDVTAPGAMAQEGWLPMQGNSTDLDDGFGHWLAGFADGEGSFSILRHNAREAYHCQFVIGLRDDDEPILVEIQARTGIGILSRRTTELGRDQTYWIVHRKAHCLALLAIFDRYPLRAKKARDYAVWRDAVLEWERWTGKARGSRQRQPFIDWRRMASLKRRLHAVRAYPGASIGDADVIVPDPQLTLLEG